MDVQNLLSWMDRPLNRILESVFENMSQVFGLYSPDFSQVLYINPTYERVWGRSLASLYANPKSLIESIHPEDSDRINAALALLIGGQSIDLEYRIVFPDGSLRWIYLRAFPLFDGHGQIEFLAGIAEDISDRKKVEDIESQAQKQRASQQIIQAIRASLKLEDIFRIAVNEIGKLLEIDHVKISKFISEDVGWQTVAEYMSHPGIPESIGYCIPDKGNPGTAKLKRLEIFRIDDTNNCENEVIRQIAQSFPGAWLILPLHFNSIVWGSLCLLIDGRPRYWQEDEIKLIKNIADQLAIAIHQSQLYQQVQALAEAEVSKALQRERELSDAKSRFIANTSHEILTPLAIIQSSLDILQHYEDQLADHKKQLHFQKIEAAIQRATEIVEDNLFLSEAESLQVQLTQTNLIQLCQDVIENTVSYSDNTSRIEFLTFSNNNQEVNHRQKLTAFIDPKLTQYILTNLVKNALKYSPPDTTIKFHLCSDSETIKFIIQDQGIGIPSTDLPHIFDSFYRANNVGNINGTGLGLAIVKQCVGLQKGQIHVDSQEGIGTKFTVILPIRGSGGD